ncbi:MAG: extracellular solute-binding protein [Ruminococcaceae bacterium]|nr:extracellular solute-binding protein [Oscillospiraceae bacterium]
MRENNTNGRCRGLRGSGVAGKRFIRTVEFALAAVLMLTAAPFGMLAGATESEPLAGTDPEYASTNFSESSYATYREENGEKPFYAGEDIVISAADLTEDTNMNYEIYPEYEGVSNAVLLKDETAEQETEVRDELAKDMPLVETELAYVTYKFTVPETALYEVAANYFPIVNDLEGNKLSNGATIERGFMIDGAYPFDECQSVSFSRVWADDAEVGTEFDSSGNEIKPGTTEVPVWRTEYLNGDETFFYDAFRFYLEAGEHTLTVVSKRADLLVESFVLTAPKTLPTYAEVKAEYEAKGYKPVSENAIVKVEGEQTSTKSEASIYPFHSRASVLNSSSTGKFTYDHTQINSLGGELWDKAGEWVTWDVEVEESGLYMITLRGRQNVNRGVNASRALTINGEYPFEEAKECTFYYSADFGYYTLGDTKADVEGEENAFLFYFEAGKTYTIGLEATLGTTEDLARRLDESVNALMTAYRRFLALCGTNPDVDTDYNFHIYLPNEIQTLADQAKVLRDLSQELYEITGERSANSAVLDRTADRCEKMVNRPILIAKNLNGFKSDVSAISEWILSLQTQPLEIDCFYLTGSKDVLPDNTAGFFRTIGHEVRLLFSSFVVDYSSVGAAADEDEAITVWFTPAAAAAAGATVAGGGREQAQILKRLIEEDFNDIHPDIAVNLQIIGIDALLPATLAGKGPDVVIGTQSNKPVNYALRGAVIDLAQFEDCDEILQRFYPSSYTSFCYGDGVYALPENQGFQVLYYRTDIFEEYGLEVPETWEDVYDIIPELANSYMNFGYKAAPTNLFTLIFQRHGVLYQGEGELFGYRTGLDTDEAVAAFIHYVNLYRSYGVDLDIDFTTRFRSGEVPLGIEDITQVNKLAISAPEIAGSWSFTLIPGVTFTDENGNDYVDHSVATSGNGTIILAKSDKQAESWEFIKWWSSDDIQIEYCAEVEATMGKANRIFSANKAVVYTQGWSSEELNKILIARSWTDGVDEVPGSYYTERHMQNAFTRTYNIRTDPRETLLDYIDEINLELTKKRVEFGLPTGE